MTTTAQTFSTSDQNAADVYARAGIVVVPTSQALGAEIQGVDLSQDMDSDIFAAVHRAWLEHCVIRFRNQNLSDANLIAFSRRFGDLDRPPNTGGRTMADPDNPEIYVISNVIENGEPIGDLGDIEADWHTDLSYTAIPAKASALYALEIPEDGSGDTGFLNMYLAYETLPNDLRNRIEDLKMKHNTAYALQGGLRVGFNADEHEDITTSPGPTHPIVRTHPETKRKALYLGRQWNGKYRHGHVLGMTLEESNVLQDELWDHIRGGQDRLTWFQQWQVDDYIMWDNRCVMHYRPAFTPSTRRVMHRTQIKGDEAPF